MCARIAGLMCVFFAFIVACLPIAAFSGVLVSVPPQKYLVERITDGLLPVAVIVPQGMSPHSYEPTPQQVLAMEGHTVWFRIGEPFEERVIPMLRTTQVIDQREGVDLLHHQGCCCAAKRDSFDSHLWTSPRCLQHMALQIRDALSIYWPEHQVKFAHHTASLLADLMELDCWIQRQLEDKISTILLVTHPAFGYFCRDYGLLQVSLEQEGKEPTARHLTALVEHLKTEPLRCVVLEPQHPMKGGQRVAHLLGLDTVVIDPYREDIFDNLREITQLF